MAVTSDLLKKILYQLDNTVLFSSMKRFTWKRQTDTVQEAFIVARFFADLGQSALLVDGHINAYLKKEALESQVSVKQFFNSRFHDFGFKWRRILVFDTITTNKMGRRGSGRDKLHFHAMIQLPTGWSQAQLRRLLEKVFGKANEDGKNMGRRQFNISLPDRERHKTYNGARGSGAVGKFLYAIEHAGSTYNSLKLNGDKRSRKSPEVRGSCNREAKGLAKGIASNFNSKVVFCDAVSKRAGKEAFEAWVKAERELMRRPTTAPVANDKTTQRGALQVKCATANGRR